MQNHYTSSVGSQLIYATEVLNIVFVWIFLLYHAFYVSMTAVKIDDWEFFIFDFDWINIHFHLFLLVGIFNDRPIRVVLRGVNEDYFGVLP